MNRDEWAVSTDPEAMIRHLAERGCNNDFARLEDELLDRVRPEISEAVLLRFLRSPDEETQDDVRERMAKLGRRAAKLDFSDPQAQIINRQLQIADAILVYEGQGAAEIMFALSAGLATLFDDVAAERAWQAETIRRLYSYDYTPPPEDGDTEEDDPETEYA